MLEDYFEETGRGEVFNALIHDILTNQDVVQPDLHLRIGKEQNRANEYRHEQDPIRVAHHGNLVKTAEPQQLMRTPGRKEEDRQRDGEQYHDAQAHSEQE